MSQEHRGENCRGHRHEDASEGAHLQTLGESRAGGVEQLAGGRVRQLCARSDGVAERIAGSFGRVSGTASGTASSTWPR